MTLYKRISYRRLTACQLKLEKRRSLVRERSLIWEREPTCLAGVGCSPHTFRRELSAPLKLPSHFSNLNKYQSSSLPTQHFATPRIRPYTITKCIFHMALSTTHKERQTGHHTLFGAKWCLPIFNLARRTDKKNPTTDARISLLLDPHLDRTLYPIFLSAFSTLPLHFMSRPRYGSVVCQTPTAFARRWRTLNRAHW
jgi:hypothetical protein